MMKEFFHQTMCRTWLLIQCIVKQQLVVSILDGSAFKGQVTNKHFVLFFLKKTKSKICFHSEK